LLPEVPPVRKARFDPRFQIIPRERVADRVATELLRLIAAGDLAPGERLPGERQLADMMSVSRVSVRAALQQLKTQGLVSAVQGGGTRIIAASNEGASALSELIRVNRDNLHDLAEIRASIEVWAARRAAEHGTPEQIAEIERHIELMSRPGRAERHKAEDDLHFHMAIAKASGSAVYMHLMSVLSEILEEMFAYHRYRLHPGPEYDRLLFKQHSAVCVAIRARDGEAAARAMAEHLDTVLSSYGEDRNPDPDEGLDEGKDKIRIVSG
jgi:DNA-binding FadR family transcriptional regulator